MFCRGHNSLHPFSYAQCWQELRNVSNDRPLPTFTVQRLHNDLRLMLTYNSNAIEGNTLSLAETQMVLEFDDYVPLIDLIGLAVEHALDLYLEACVESSVHLLPLHELAREFTISVDYLGQLARKGKIEATKRGQYWYASKEAVQNYLTEANNQPRGRQRKS